VDHSTNRRPVIDEIRLAYTVHNEAISNPHWLHELPLLRTELGSSRSIIVHPDDPFHVDLKFALIDRFLKMSFMLLVMLGGAVGCAALGYFVLLGNETPAGITRYGGVTSAVLAVLHTVVFLSCLTYWAVKMRRVSHTPSPERGGPGD
jgi:hypothetical protein